MNFSVATCCRVCGFLVFCLSHGLSAQSLLPLQPHKLKLAQKLCREGILTKKPILVAEGYYEYGKLYTAAGDYLTAQRWFMKSLRILEPLGDSYELARLHVRLADLLFLQANYTASLDHAHQALAIARRSQSNKGLIRACAVLARIHGRNWATEASPAQKWPSSNGDSALYYFRKVEKLAYQLNDPMEVAHVKQDIGNQLVGRNDPRALSYLGTALTMATKQKSPDRLGILVNIASAQLRFGNPKRAWPYIRQAQQLADTEYSNVYYWESIIEQTLIEFYRATGNWKQVAAHAEKIHQWEKRDLIADREGAVSRLGLEYETEKKELLLKAQKKELTLQTENLLIQQRVAISTSVLLVVMIGMSLVFFRLYRKNQRISAQNAELVQEQNHRVKNNLQVISSLLSLQSNRLVDAHAKKAVEESQLRIEAMAILHRRLYEGDKLARVSLPEFVRELVETVLQTFGYAGVEPVYALDPIDLSADQALPIGLIINELTTNACKYAFPDNADPLFRVSCRQHKNQITMTVADNGPGLMVHPATDPLRTAPGTFGLRLIQMQVNQLGGTCRFSAQEGTLFTLTFTT